jgi:hypothetical protein
MESKKKFDHLKSLNETMKNENQSCKMSRETAEYK